MATYVGNVEGKGRGVFTDKKVYEGEIIESAQVIEFPAKEWEHIAETIFGVYCYFWGEDMKDGVMVLGNGSLYNHSYNPNAEYIRRTSDKVMDYVAIKDIEAGEEITINYNGVTGCMDPVWFDVIE